MPKGTKGFTMKTFRTVRMCAPGEFISSVSGSTGDYDLTLDDGTIIEGYDEGEGNFTSAAPAIGDLVMVGALTGHQLLSAAVGTLDIDVIPAAQAANFVIPADA
jgi:hypothetical protein